MIQFFVYLLIIILLLLLFVWLFLRLDCDLQLFFAEKFGEPITNLKGKVIWITGASSGIGESLAYVLSSVGAKLILSGTNETKLEEVKKQCMLCGKLDESDIIVIKFDIRDLKRHQLYFDTALSHFKKIDILVNNAGRSQRALFEDIDIEVDKELFDINVFGLINFTRIVLRYFLNNKIEGQFVVTSSGAGKLGVPNSSSYTASKHALHGYFESLRTEAQSKGITITMTCPGPVFSNISERAFTGEVGKAANIKHHESYKRMATSRCAYLTAISIVNRIDEAWISIQPVLTLYYMSQYFPTITRKLFHLFATPDRMAKLREGHN